MPSKVSSEAADLRIGGIPRAATISGRSATASERRLLAMAAHRSLAALALLLVVGCEAPNRTAAYPEGALQVRYESATQYTTCLVASVAMAANYLLDERRFTEAGIRQGLREAGLDETRIGDMQTYLANKGLHLVTLRGRMDGKPPASLRYWLLQRGYPVICIINRQPDNPDSNHAVVVIGISQTAPPESADKIHYLDPASPKQLHSEEVAAFEALWAPGQNAMLIVVSPPGTQPVPGGE